MTRGVGLFLLRVLLLGPARVEPWAADHGDG